MAEWPLIIKFAEVVIMEVLVAVAVVALLIAAVRDIVEAKVLASRRRDQIALDVETQASVTPAAEAQKPVAPQPANLTL